MLHCYAGKALVANEVPLVRAEALSICCDQEEDRAIFEVDQFREEELLDDCYQDAILLIVQVWQRQLI